MKREELQKHIMNSLEVIEEKIEAYDNKVIEVVCLVDKQNTLIESLVKEHKVYIASGNIDEGLEVAEQLDKAKADLVRLEDAIVKVREAKKNYVDTALRELYVSAQELHEELNKELDQLDQSTRAQLRKLHEKSEDERLRKVAGFKSMAARWESIARDIIEPPTISSTTADKVDYLKHFQLQYLTPQDGQVSKLLNDVQGLFNTNGDYRVFW